MPMDKGQRYRTGSEPAGGGFNELAAGPKRYGQAGLRTPNLGPVSDLLGYAKRDRESAARRNLILKRMQYNDKLKFVKM